MDILLNHIQARALGALIEKEITTPDYYPLSLNALVNACNQKNNREPVMNVDETGVREALERLQEHLLAGPARGADSRVSKYEHRLQEVFNLSRAETAVLCRHLRGCCLASRGQKSLDMSICFQVTLRTRSLRYSIVLARWQRPMMPIALHGSRRNWLTFAATSLKSRNSWHNSDDNLSEVFYLICRVPFGNQRRV